MQTYLIQKQTKETIEKAKISKPERLPINIFVYNYLDYFMTMQ